MSFMETTVKKKVCLKLNLFLFFSLDTCSTHLPVEMLAVLSTQVGTCSLIKKYFRLLARPRAEIKYLCVARYFIAYALRCLVLALARL